MFQSIEEVFVRFRLRFFDPFTPSSRYMNYIHLMCTVMHFTTICHGKLLLCAIPHVCPLCLEWCNFQMMHPLNSHLMDVGNIELCLPGATANHRKVKGRVLVLQHFYLACEAQAPPPPPAPSPPLYRALHVFFGTWFPF